MQTISHNMMMYLSTLVEDAPGQMTYMPTFWTYQLRSRNNEKRLASKGHR